MSVGRFGRIGAVVALLVGGAFACRAPVPEGQTPVEPTEAYLPTETILEQVPPTEIAEEWTLTWLASGVYLAGEPHDGWQDYAVTLGYENSTEEARAEILQVTMGGEAKLVTREGHIYEFNRLLDWIPSVGSSQDCQWPRKGTDRRPTGVIPPGFRVRGAVLVNVETGRPCTAELTVWFSVGESLHPETLVLSPSREISLSVPDQIYGPIDSSRTFDRLPAVLSMGKMEVALIEAARAPNGSILIDLAYKNTDSASEAPLCNPVAAVIDSHGYLSTPLGVTHGLFWEQKERFAEYCGDPYLDWAKLGPLQEAQVRTCVPSNPSNPAGTRYFLMACGWGEDVTADWAELGLCRGQQLFDSKIMFMSPGYMESECHVFELDIGR